MKSPSTLRRLWAGLAVLALLSPLGLVLPSLFNAGDAWGEWDAEGIRKLAGYVPAGLERLAGMWRAPMPDYAFGEQGGMVSSSAAYIVSAAIGIALTAAVVLLLGRLLAKGRD